MPDRYRLFVRARSEGGYRGLVLRDPTPDGKLVQTPIREILESEDGKERWRRRWLHGLPSRMQFSKVSLPGFTSVRVLPAPGEELDFESVERPGGDGLQVELFASLARRPPGLASDSPQAAEFDAQVQGLVDAFCCTKADKATTGDSGIAADTESALVGVPALIQVYLSDLSLLDLARAGVEENGQPGPITLAVLSGYAFDTKGMPSLRAGLTAAQIAFTNTDPAEPPGVLELVASRAGQEVDLLPLAHEQESEGIYLKVDWRLVTSAPDAASILTQWKQAGELLSAGNLTKESLPLINQVSDHTLLVRRSVGAVPVEPGESLGRMPTLVMPPRVTGDATTAITESQPRMPFSEFFFVDRLETRQWEGELLYYQVELRDMLDRVVAKGAISVRRERLDPPRMPRSAVAELRKDGSLGLVVELPVGEPDLQPVVWFQRRPLDACGFYGTDDDLALLEGLQQADLNFEEGADEQEPDRDWEGHPVARYLRGAYDRHGLEVLSADTDKESPLKSWEQLEAERPETTEQDASGKVLSLTLSVEAVRRLCQGGNAGLRFFVGLRRRASGGRQIESVLLPAEHCLRHESADRDGKPLRRLVFQIEALTETSGSRTFLPAEEFDLHLLHSGALNPNPLLVGWKRTEEGPAVGQPWQVQVSIHGPKDGRAIGGYRVYLRDVLGEEAPSFTPIRQFEAVPPLVYRYRPYGIDSTRRLRAKPGAPTTPFELAAPSSFAELTASFDALAEWLRKQPGPPRLARAGDSSYRAPGKPLEPPKPLRVRSEQVDAVIREVGPPVAATCAVVVKLLNQAIPAAEPSELERQSAIRKRVYGHWGLVGLLVDWMYANGFARDLILPLGVSQTSQVEQLLEQCPTLKDRQDWVALVVQPLSGCPNQRDGILGTVRLCLLPGQADVGWGALTPDWQQLLAWAWGVFRGRIVELEEDLTDADLLPFHGAEGCRFAWDGIKDGWCHQLEVVVETLDRYAMAWAFFDSKLVKPDPEDEAAPQVLEQRPLLCDPPPELSSLDESDKPAEARVPKVRWINVHRLHPAPEPPALFSVRDPQRVSFRIQESPERLHAAHNLLNRVRQGRLTTLVQFSYTLPGLPTYTALGLGDDWAAPPDEPRLTAGASPVSTDPPPFNRDWTAAREDEVAVCHALYFLEYTLRARFRADLQEDAKECSAVRGSRLPENLETSRAEGANLGEPTDGTCRLTLPLLRLWDLLTPAERAVAIRVYGADPLIQRALQWPDLAITYTVLCLVRPGPSQIFTPLLSIRPPDAPPAPVKFTVSDPNPDFFNDPAQLGAEFNPASRELRLTLPADRLPSAPLFLSIARGELWAGPVPILRQST